MGQWMPVILDLSSAKFLVIGGKPGLQRRGETKWEEKERRVGEREKEWHISWYHKPLTFVLAGHKLVLFVF